MSNVKYKLRITGLPTADGTISFRSFRDLLDNLAECAERGLRLAVEGSSIKTGRPPAWLEKAVNLNITGLKAGSTIVELEAPTLGDVIGDVSKQQDFWMQAPSPSDTALTLFSKSVQDTTAENLESPFYDGGVLKSLLKLKPFLKIDATRVQLTSDERPSENISLTMAEIEKAERLKIKIPEPQAFIISGHLDAIQHSEKRFQLALPNNQTVPGRVDEEFITAEQLREFWGREVTVKGLVHFKPSGRIQLFQAQIIKEKGPGEEIFQQAPVVQALAEFAVSTAQAAERNDWLKNIWGKWPGDEPLDVLLKELNQR